MVRYVQRPWYHPIGFMSQSTPAYPLAVAIVGVLMAWPFRYYISDYAERCSPDPGALMRARAIAYYHDLEQWSRRQGYLWFPGKDDGAVRVGASRPMESLQAGSLEFDQSYFSAHARDMMRARELLAEVRELKGKMAEAKQ